MKRKSKSSPASKILAQEKPKRYFMGWVAACHAANITGDNVFYLQERKKPDADFETKIFKTQAAAATAIRKEKIADGSKIAVRKYAYETHIPKHAKNMVKWKDTDSTEWIFLK